MPIGLKLWIFYYWPIFLRGSFSLLQSLVVIYSLNKLYSNLVLIQFWISFEVTFGYSDKDSLRMVQREDQGWNFDSRSAD